jgi:hypothetical protein
VRSLARGGRFGWLPSSAFDGRSGKAITDLRELSDDLLEALNLAFVGDLVLLGIFNQFENLLHVMQGLLEAVHDTFHFEHRLFNRSRGCRAIRESFDFARQERWRFGGEVIAACLGVGRG